MRADKETRIKKELKRLTAIYSSLPDNKYNLILPILENAAFMKATLEDLQTSINEAGCVDEYQNGSNQFGKKQSADIQAYNGLIKNYNAISARLEKMLPAEQQKSKLEELLNA